MKKHQVSENTNPQMLNVWYIYLHLTLKLPKCWEIGHTLSIWDQIVPFFLKYVGSITISRPPTKNPQFKKKTY